MLNMTSYPKTIGTLLLAVCLATAHAIEAGADTGKTSDTQQSGERPAKQQPNDKKQADQSAEVNESLHESVKDAMISIRAAIRLLGEGKNKQALTRLQTADGEIDTAIAAQPNLANITVSNRLQTFKTGLSNEEIDTAIDDVIDLLEDNRLDAARKALIPLREEILLRTESLPLATFPPAIKNAVTALADNEPEHARRILLAMAGTIVITETTVPLPLFNARDALVRAEQLSKTEPQKAVVELKSARQQLHRARLLGYIDEDSTAYERLDKKIEALLDKNQKPNEIEKLYESLKSEAMDLWQEYGL